MDRKMSFLSQVRLSILILAAIPSVIYAQVPIDVSMRVDEIFAPWTSVSSPGCAVGVAVDGLTVLERAYGMADLEHGISNKPETIFEGGSVSKQFTAAAIMLLALDGKLSLEDDIRKYVPEVPNYGPTITLRHLMTHTSGLRDWGSVAGISGWGREQRSHTHEHVLDIVSRQSAANFDPGHEYSYSNTGYNLLAIVVDRLAGMSFADFSKERIFEPLGMNNTQWRDDYRRLVPGRSTAYSARPGRNWVINRPIEYVHGNGGILTTVGDLMIWNEALTDGRLGGPDFVRMMHNERGRLSNGAEIIYAGGLQHGTMGGVRSVTHTGSTAGYRAFLGRYPDHKLSVAMLCNASNVSTGGTGSSVARAFLGDVVTEATPPEPASVSAMVLERYVGLYRDPVTGNTRTLTLTGGELRDGNTTLIPLSETHFQAGAADRIYRFQLNQGQRARFKIEAWQYTNQVFEPVEAWSPNPDEFISFEGTYTSYDAETTFLVEVIDDVLTLSQRPGRTRMLTPIYPNAFSSGGQIIRFKGALSGETPELSLSLGRVYDMKFQKTRN